MGAYAQAPPAPKNWTEVRLVELRRERSTLQKDLDKALEDHAHGLVDRLEGAIEDITREILQAQGLIL